MDRQLSVWAPPALVLFCAMIAFFVGGAPFDMPKAEKAVFVSSAEPPADLLPPSSGSGIPAKPDKPAEPEPEPEAAATKPEPEPEPEAPAASQEPAPAYDGPGGSVRGRIVLKGDAPAAGDDINVPDGQVSTCCGDKMDLGARAFRSGTGGGVVDVVVVIEADGAEADGSGSEFVMDQVCCRFEPHVLVVPQGGTVLYKNSDSTNHNVNTKAKKNKNINSNMAGGSSTTTPLPKSEQFTVGCDIHPWMQAQVFVSEFTTYAVTGADGSFQIDGVPPGEWKVEIWSETLKAASKYKVTVKGGETSQVEWEVQQGGGRRR